MFVILPAPLQFIDLFFFFNDTATTEIYTLSLHDALPISIVLVRIDEVGDVDIVRQLLRAHEYWRMKQLAVDLVILNERELLDRKSTRLNSSHVRISYAVFCLKKKNTQINTTRTVTSRAIT